MLDSTNPAVMEAGPEAGRRAVRPQLDEPGGRRGEAGADLRAGEEVRRGGRRRHDRRGQAQRHGPHGASGRSRSPSASATWRSTSTACATRT